METHTTVLLHESVEGLNLEKGDAVIDATLGLGGHTEAIAKVVGERGEILAIEEDEGALVHAKNRLKEVKTKIHFSLGNFRDVDAYVVDSGICGIKGILFDLGWNSTQLEAGRGFSFKKDDPLLMTFSKNVDGDTVTAEKIVNTWSESDLKEIIQTLGEERFSGRIAKAIVESRSNPILKANQLAEIISESVPSFYRKGRIHPATKTFQALRIVVNDELSTLTTALNKSIPILDKGGRIAVITFHSLEDGLVKRIFRQFVKEGNGILVNKKPITPKREEVIANPRARSAKLRIIEKI